MELNKDFRLTSKHRLGRGTSSNVYPGIILRRGAILPEETKCAIKIFVQRSNNNSEFDAADKDLVYLDADFRYEVALMHWIGFTNAHIVPMLGFCLNPLAIVMPFYDTSLGHLLAIANALEETQAKIVKFNLDDCLKIARQVSHGMAHIHERKVIHLDLKPGK